MLLYKDLNESAHSPWMSGLMADAIKIMREMEGCISLIWSFFFLSSSPFNLISSCLKEFASSAASPICLRPSPRLLKTLCLRCPGWPTVLAMLKGVVPVSLSGDKMHSACRTVENFWSSLLSGLMLNLASFNFPSWIARAQFVKAVACSFADVV